MVELIVLSHFQAEPMLSARRDGLTSLTTSLDLGRTEAVVTLAETCVRFPDGQELLWATIRKISESENQCFLVRENEARAIQVFSDTTNWARSLMPTRGAPTTLVAGFPMHRIKDTDPHEDTLKKIETLAPVTGRVLDTATGLGYTAIEAARTATHVTTIEYDPAALEIARLNPWSRELFDNPKITQEIGDAFELIAAYPDDFFARVLHDPPTFSLAGDLYSEAFYRHIYRVLAPGGRIFHYIGDPASKFGRRMTTGVVSRLREVGFRKVVGKPQAFGVLATK